jgi:transcriptional regulator with XRE-family HTH domain
MVTVTLHIGTSYIKELKVRLRKDNVSARAVSLEMGVDPSQFSRWMTGKVAPRMDTVEQIEGAITRIKRKREQSKA